MRKNGKSGKVWYTTTPNSIYYTTTPSGEEELVREMFEARARYSAGFDQIDWSNGVSPRPSYQGPVRRDTDVDWKHMSGPFLYPDYVVR